MRKFFKNLTGYKIEPETDEEEAEQAEDENEDNEDENIDEEIDEEETNEEETDEEDYENTLTPAVASEAENGDDEEDKQWLDQEEYDEGQLSIDVYQTPQNIVVKSTIAGVKPDDIDISINNDLLTIRGTRQMQEKVKEENYLFRECYWGSFSRSIILPVEIIPEKIDATLENGVLTIILPKAKATKQISIKVKSK